MDKCGGNSVASRTRSRYSRMANMVFEIELLREIILDYAIHDERIVQPSYVQSCRLVNKAWLQSISTVLLKYQEPVFKFTFDPEINGEALDQFSSSVAGSSRLEERVPPHSISVTGDVFGPNCSQSLMVKSLLDCFANCGSGLVDLYLHVPGCEYFSLLPTSVSFPKLGSFKLSVFIDEEKDASATASSVGKMIDFMQAVFNSSSQLKSFAFKTILYADSHPVSLERLKLPPSLTELALKCPLNDGTLEILAQNPLPKLETLKLRAIGSPFEKHGIITSVLQNVSKTLQYFRLKEDKRVVRDANERPTTFQLPQMEKLQFLEMCNTFMEFEGNPSSLQDLVPVLNQMELGRQTISSLRKWVDNSCFNSVTSLAISVCIEMGPGFFPDANINLSTMRAVQTAFPNIEKLEITFGVIELPDPAFEILWEMKTLRSLSIFEQDASEFFEESYYSNSNVWDALLMGIPEQDVPIFKDSPDGWKEMQARNPPSIRNLAALETLKLGVCDGRYRLISDVTFQLTFFKMPNLRNLILEGGFSATAEMKKEWVRNGRTIEAELTYNDASPAGSGQEDSSDSEEFSTDTEDNDSDFD